MAKFIAYTLSVNPSYRMYKKSDDTMLSGKKHLSRILWFFVERPFGLIQYTEGLTWNTFKKREENMQCKNDNFISYNCQYLTDKWLM